MTARTSSAGADTGRCPVCRKPSHREAAGKVFPFCGARCWAIDLGKWLGEDYRIASDEPATGLDGDPD